MPDFDGAKILSATYEVVRSGTPVSTVVNMEVVYEVGNLQHENAITWSFDMVSHFFYQDRGELAFGTLAFAQPVGTPGKTYRIIKFISLPESMLDFSSIELVMFTYWVSNEGGYYSNFVATNAAEAGNSFTKKLLVLGGLGGALLLAFRKKKGGLK